VLIGLITLPGCSGGGGSDDDGDTSGSDTSEVGTLSNPYPLEIGTTHNFQVMGFQDLCGGQTLDLSCSEFDQDHITVKFELADAGNYKITASDVEADRDLEVFVYRTENPGSSIISYLGTLDQEGYGGDEVFDFYLDDIGNEYYLILRSWNGADDIQLEIQDMSDDTTLWQEDFTSFNSSDYYIQGTNSYWESTNHDFVLTKDSSNQKGRLFLKKAISMSSWEANFEIRIAEGPGSNFGADGMAFAFVKDFTYAGTHGGYLDFGGDGYGIEFDVFSNQNKNDPSGQHLGIIDDWTGSHIETQPFSENIWDGVWHSARVVFNDGVITVYFDNTAMLTDVSIPGYTPFIGYFGFTASTGDASEFHRIRNVDIKVYSP